MKEYQVELLAPAGNMEAFLGAIHAGADAVYLSGNKYGARAYADNFTTEDLVFCIRYAHIWGRKLYLTVNTLLKDCEIQNLREYIQPLYEAGLDACIVQDYGVFQFLKRNFPQMELHASTQMTITGANGASLLKDLGASRIVPARELSLEEIKVMKEETGLEMETFVHGAMCYCYSGQCLFSSILGGRSGNRGRCAQPCRLPYQVSLPDDLATKNKHKTQKEYYPLSLKDMCTLEHIEALMDAGIDSFKIEGRMKKAEYAAGVTAIYRKYIDLKKANPTKSLKFQKEDLENLAKLYIRSERQDGYYFKQNGADMITLTNPAYSGSDDALLSCIRSKYIEQRPKLSVSIFATFMAGERASVTCIYKNLSVTIEGGVVATAQNMPLSEESIKKQLLKLGDTCFEVEDINIYTDNLSFCPVKELNDLRRQVVKKLEDEIIISHGLCSSRIEAVSTRHTTSVEPLNNTRSSEKPTNGWTIGCTTKEQLVALKRLNDNNTSFLLLSIYLESELLLQAMKENEEGEYLSLIQDIKSHHNHMEFYISLPYVMRKKEEGKLKQLIQIVQCDAFHSMITGFLARNTEEYVFLKNQGYSGKIKTDSSIYIWNKESLDFWSERVDGVHCPLELNKKEWTSLFCHSSFEKLIYGRIPMMTTANCVIKTTAGCLFDDHSHLAFLTDRYNKKFPVRTVCTYCHNIVYNSVPLSLHKEISNSLHEYDKKLQFTVESQKETTEILNFFKKIAAGQLTEPPFKDYTTGHEKRGVL